MLYNIFLFLIIDIILINRIIRGISLIIMELQEVAIILEEFIKQKNTNVIIFAWLKLKTLHIMNKKKNVPLLDRTRSLANLKDTLRMAENTQNIYRDPKSQQKRLFKEQRELKYGTYSHLHHLTRSRKVLSEYQKPLGFQQLVMERLGKLQQNIADIKDYSSVKENSNQNFDLINSRSIMNCFYSEFSNDNRNSLGPISLRNKQSYSSLRSPKKIQLESSSIRPTRMNSEYFQTQIRQSQQIPVRIPKITHQEIQRCRSTSMKTKSWKPRFLKGSNNNYLENILQKIKVVKNDAQQQNQKRKIRIQEAVSNDKISKKIKQIRQKITMGRPKGAVRKSQRIQPQSCNFNKFSQQQYSVEMNDKVITKSQPFKNLQIKFIKTQEQQQRNNDIEYGLSNDNSQIKVNKSILKNANRKVLVRKPQSRQQLKSIK